MLGCLLLSTHEHLAYLSQPQILFTTRPLVGLPSLIWHLNCPSRLLPAPCGFPPQCCQALHPHIMPSPRTDIVLVLSLAIPTHRCPLSLLELTPLDFGNPGPSCLSMCVPLSACSSSFSLLHTEPPCPPTSS